MSLKDLIDAAEYVDKDNGCSETASDLSNDAPSLATAQRKLSGDTTIKHWRKIAVAQSVMEWNHKTSEQSSDHAGSQEINDDNEDSTQEAHQGTNPATDTHKTLPYLQIQATSSYGVPAQQDGFSSQSAKSEDAIALSSNAHPSTSPLPTPRKSVASSPQGTAMNIDTLPPTSPRLPHNFYSTQLYSHRDQSGDTKRWYSSSEEYEVSKKRNGAREAHNLLEKSRRKHLKQCYEALRSVMPNLGAKTSHLIILREAMKCIQILEERRQNLQDYRYALSQENTMKRNRLKQLKEQLLKNMSETDLENLLTKASLQQQSTENEVDIPIKKSVGVQNTLPAMKGHDVNGTQKGQAFAPVNGFVPVPANNVFPPLSSTMNLVNEARRLCTMLPTMGILTSSEVQKNARTVGVKPVASYYQPIRFSSSVGLRTPFRSNTIHSSYGNVRAYTGFSVTAGGNFMQPSPLKIVVKPVGSAKQQARVSRTPSISDVGNNELPSTDHPAMSKNLNSPFSSQPRLPAPDGIVISSIRGVGAASPPLLSTDQDSINTSEKKGKKGCNNFSRQSSNEKRVYNRPRSKSDVEDLSDDSDIFIPPKRRKHGSSNESFPSNSWKAFLRRRFHRKSFPQPSDSDGLNLNSNEVSDRRRISGVSNEPKKHHSPVTLVAQMDKPVSQTGVSVREHPNKSITQVSFTTLNNAISAIPAIGNVASAGGQGSRKSPDGNEASENDAVAPNEKNTISASPQVFVPTSPSIPQNMYAMSMAQNMVPVMMPVMASPSMGFMMPAKSHEVYSSASTNPVTQTVSSSSNSEVQANRAQTQPETYAMKPQVPQFQYMMPMAFPGMMGGSNCSPMMMQAPMGNFVQMMPQGQGWGFMMPQGMMMMASNQKNMNIQPQSMISQASSKGENARADEGCPATTTSVSTVVQSPQPPSPSSSTKSSEKSAVAAMAPMPQQISMAPSFQNANHYMMPMPTGQSGGMYFGGTPTMMPTPMPMNVVGFPMQFGGSNSFQMAFPGSNFNVQQSIPQLSSSGNNKQNTSDTSNPAAADKR